MATYILWEIAKSRLQNEGFKVYKTWEKLSCSYNHAPWGNLWIKSGKVSQKSLDTLIKKIRDAKS